jgi:adenylosuccinate synthase
MFGSQHRCVVVVGAQWGDEGKGKIVDVLAHGADLVVRYQGGANAGHTVVNGDDEFILHQIPAGILHPATTCVIGNGVVLDPETLVEEINELEERGVSVEGRLMISDRAHLVLPYHKMLDRAAERRQKIGTTGRGIGPTYEDKIGRRGLRVGDLRTLANGGMDIAVRERVNRVNELLTAMGADERAAADDHMAFLAAVADRLIPHIADTSLFTFSALAAGERVLLEGAQGALLDVDHGTYPFVTSSNTTAGGAAIGAGIGPTAIDVVLGVVKAYTTRVGNGPLPTEAEHETAERLRTLGGEFGATTGRPRRCGWFDAVVVRYAARVNGLTHLAVTKLDVLDTIHRIPVCVAYDLDGEPVPHLPSDPAVLDRVTPVYETLDGWNERTADARKLSDLPTGARAYLERLEAMIGTPIRYVSVGTRRDQIIEIP